MITIIIQSLIKTLGLRLVSLALGFVLLFQSRKIALLLRGKSDEFFDSGNRGRIDMSNKNINYFAMRLLCIAFWCFTLVNLALYLRLSLPISSGIEKSMFTYISSIFSLCLFGMAGFFIWGKTEKIVNYLDAETKQEEGLVGFFSLLFFTIGLIMTVHAIIFVLQWLSLIGMSYEGKGFVESLSSLFISGLFISYVLQIILGCILMTKSKNIALWIRINGKAVNNRKVDNKKSPL